MTEILFAFAHDRICLSKENVGDGNAAYHNAGRAELQPG